MDGLRTTSQIGDNSFKSMKKKTILVTRLSFKTTPISFIFEQFEKCFEHIESNNVCR